MVLIVAIKNSEMGYFKAIITLADKKKAIITLFADHIHTLSLVVQHDKIAF